MDGKSLNIINLAFSFYPEMWLGICIEEKIWVSATCSRETVATRN